MEELECRCLVTGDGASASSLIAAEKAAAATGSPVGVGGREGRSPSPPLSDVLYLLPAVLFLGKGLLLLLLLLLLPPGGGFFAAASADAMALALGVLASSAVVLAGSFLSAFSSSSSSLEDPNILDIFLPRSLLLMAAPDLAVHSFLIL